MTPELLQSFSDITNPILRMMIWFLAIAVTGLTSAVVFLYKERQELQREMLASNREAITALTNAANALEALQEALQSIRTKLNA